MVSLDFLTTVDQYLSRSKFLYKILSTILGGLSIIIFFGNFFQFLPVIEKFLWKMSLSSYKKHKQHIGYHFANIITLIKQMRQ